MQVTQSEVGAKKKAQAWEEGDKVWVGETKVGRSAHRRRCVTCLGLEGDTSSAIDRERAAIARAAALRPPAVMTPVLFFLPGRSAGERRVEEEESVASKMSHIY